MVNDLISTINSNNGVDLVECKKFLSFLKNDKNLSDEIIKSESKKFFLSKKFLFKKVFVNSSSVREMSMLTAGIYSRIYTEFAESYAYKDLVNIKNNLYKIQYTLSIRDLNDSVNKFQRR